MRGRGREGKEGRGREGGMPPNCSSWIRPWAESVIEAGRD